MENSKKRFAAQLLAVWPLCFFFSASFVSAKIIYPFLDWAVVLSAVLLFVLGFQLRSKRQKLLTQLRKEETDVFPNLFE